MHYSILSIVYLLFIFESYIVTFCCNICNVSHYLSQSIYYFKTFNIFLKIITIVN